MDVLLNGEWVIVEKIQVLFPLFVCLFNEIKKKLPTVFLNLHRQYLSIIKCPQFYNYSRIVFEDE